MKRVEIMALYLLLLPAGAMAEQAYTGGLARVEFADTRPFALPEVATLRPTASSCTGNYAAAGAGVIALRLQAQGALPSHVYLELAGEAAVYQKELSVSQVGVWETFLVSLAGFSAGGWTVRRGSAADFEQTLNGVTSLVLKIRRSGAEANACAVADFVVDQAAGAAGGQWTAGSEPSLVWDALQTGAPYTLQESATLGGPWKDTTTQTATGRLQTFVLPQHPAQPHAFYRLRGP